MHQFLERKMSTIAQIFESGEQKGLKGHFRNLVMLARVNGKIEEKEQNLLNRMARRLSLTDDQVKEICEHVDEYPMVPPHSREERYERFVRFVQMVLVDGSVDPSEKTLVLQYGVALGMEETTVEEKYEAVVKMWLNGMDAQEIMDNMM